MQIRHAVPADAAAIADVSARSARDAYEPIVDDESIVELVEGPGYVDRIREWLSEVRDDDGACVLVAAADEAGDTARDAGDTARDAGDSTVDAGDSMVDAAPPASRDSLPNRGIVGFAQCLAGPAFRPEDIDEGEAYLRSLYVEPDRQGEGIGTRLLEATIEWIDTEAVVLDVLRDNRDARGFYEARNFDHVGETTVELGGAEYETSRYRREH